MSSSQAMRLFNLDLREKVQSIWDENIPVIHHTVIEIITEKKDKLDGDALIETMSEFCKDMELHVVQVTHHKFEPQGTSAVFVLEESHLAIHSWPEKGYMHIDMVTCTKDETNIIRALATLEKLYGKSNVRIISFKY